VSLLRRRTLLLGAVAVRSDGNMILKYPSGEDVRKNDIVRFHGERARVGFVVVNGSDPETEWYMQEYGGGVMVLGGVGATVFLPADHISENEDLQVVSRGTAP
jgi:hypothetical protein